jgi:ABC-type branched-subunit amino acid transport system substrate-binding protein
LVAARLVRRMTEARVTFVDIDARKLAVAREFGDFGVLDGSAVDVREALMGRTEGRGVAAVVDFVGSSQTAGLGQAVRQVISAYFEDLNARGGIYNRKIKFHFTEAGADMSTSLRNLNNQNQIFAFIGGVSAGADKEIAALAREEEIPFIGPATLLPQVEHPPNRYVFYLLPGVSEQAAALTNFADQQLGVKKQRAVVLFPLRNCLQRQRKPCWLAQKKRVGPTS